MSVWRGVSPVRGVPRRFLLCGVCAAVPCVNSASRGLVVCVCCCPRGCLSIGVVASCLVVTPRIVFCLCRFYPFVECSILSVRVRFVDGFVGVSDARLFHSRSVAYKCYWLARDVFGYGEESARVAYMAGWCHDAGYAFAPTQLDHAEVGGVILVDAGASFADAVRSHGDPDVLAMSDLLLIVNTADMMCGPDGVPVSFDERLADVEARYGVGSRQAVDVGAMLSVLRRELELRGVSVEAAERAGVERVDAVGESAESVEGAAVADDTADTGVSDAEDAAGSL